MSDLPPVRPFKPHRRLFAILCIGFAVWVSLLLAMYFKTVYPHPHRLTPATQAEPAI